MKIEIGKIKVADRIRKQSTKINELAADIRQNGLLNPITVMPVGGEHQLLAGLRRLQAAQLLGWTEIDVNVVPPKDAEAALRIEYSENEQREPFTLAEKVEYAALIEEIEKAKAKERMSQGGKGGVDKGCAPARNLTRNRTDAIASDKVGMKETSYRYARYVAEKAPEMLERIDNGEIPLRAAYNELRAAEKAPAPPAPLPPAPPAVPPKPPAPAPVAPPVPAPAHPVIKPPVVAPKPKKASPPEPVREPMPPPETPLERAIRAERELDAMKYRWDNEIFHRESIIENLKMRNEKLVAYKEALENRVAELEMALEAAQARIRELEEAGHA